MKAGAGSIFGGNQSAVEMMAFCAAGLLTLISLPHIWRASEWVTITMLVPEFGMDWVLLMRFAVFVLLTGIALAADRLSMISSVALAGLWLFAKLPIF